VWIGWIVAERSIIFLVTEGIIHGMEKQTAVAKSEAGSASAVLSHLHQVAQAPGATRETTKVLGDSSPRSPEMGSSMVTSELFVFNKTEESISVSRKVNLTRRYAVFQHLTAYDHLSHVSRSYPNMEQDFMCWSGIRSNQSSRLGTFNWTFQPLTGLLYTHNFHYGNGHVDITLGRPPNGQKTCRYFNSFLIRSRQLPTQPAATSISLGGPWKTAHGCPSRSSRTGQPAEIKAPA
jgi:hypothetical protein